MDTDNDDALARFKDLDRIIAERKTRPPGVALMVVGTLVILLGLGLAGFIVAVVLMDGLPTGSSEADGFMLPLLQLAAVAALGSLCAGGIMAFGGYRLFRVRSRGLVFAGAILSMVTGAYGLLLFGSGTRYWMVAGIALSTGLPIGGWALVVANKPLVKPAFRRRH